MPEFERTKRLRDLGLPTDLGYTVRFDRPGFSDSRVPPNDTKRASVCWLNESLIVSTDQQRLRILDICTALNGFPRLFVCPA